MNDLVLIRKNLFRRKLRAILMMVSILIAFAIFGVLASFERAFNAGDEQHTDHQPKNTKEQIGLRVHRGQAHEHHHRAVHEAREGEVETGALADGCGSGGRSGATSGHSLE